MQISDLNSKPLGVKSLRDLINRTIVVRLYPPLGSEHYRILHLEMFHESTHINDNQRENYETKIASFV